MSSTYLDGQVDIHGGGSDLIFPHHENEIAQSEAYLGVEPFARYWVHNGLVRVGAEKMSKSLGNFVRMREILDRGLGPAFRLMVLQSHYRAPLTYSEEGLLAAERGLDRLRSAAAPGAVSDATLEDGDILTAASLAEVVAQTDERFHTAMDDDFNAPEALAALFDLGRAINRARTEGQPESTVEPARQKLVELAGVLGLDLSEQETASADAAPFIDLLLRVRAELRQRKEWALSDLIRDELAALEVVVEDTPAGASWSRRRG
jgi:cysteinyl-tRNA synthetase